VNASVNGPPNIYLYACFCPQIDFLSSFYMHKVDRQLNLACHNPSDTFSSMFSIHQIQHWNIKLILNRSLRRGLSSKVCLAYPCDRSSTPSLRLSPLPLLSARFVFLIEQSRLKSWITHVCLSVKKKWVHDRNFYLQAMRYYIFNFRQRPSKGKFAQALL